MRAPTPAQAASRALLRLAEAARSDPEQCYRLVYRHELTRKPLEPAPHQKLAFSFMLAHDRCVQRQPVGTAKTSMATLFALWLLGNDVTQRGAFVSRTQAQAAKPLGQMEDYVTDSYLSKRLALVFPELQRSTRVQDSWSSKAMTVERPAGIRDPSVVAVGLDTKSSSGSRWSWFVADDTIDDENTNTPEQRAEVNNRFDGRFVSRLDPVGGRAFVTNTPWDRQDLTYHLEVEAGWPTLCMDIYGDVWFANVEASWLSAALRDHLRPSTLRPGRYRLAEFGDDPEELVPLWPERYPLRVIEQIRYGKGSGSMGMLPQQFARLMLCEPFAHGAARCQRAWVEACKARGAGMTLVSRYQGSNPTFCGVDLGFGNRERRIGGHKASDRTVFFVFELLPDKSRRVLQVESGRWSGSEIVDMIADYYARYRCQFAVENEGGQTFLRQWAIESRRDIVIRAHSTQAKNKYHLTFGVESIFAEVQQGAWQIPCDAGTGRVDADVQLWLDGMLYYQPPPSHTSDHLIACFPGESRVTTARGLVPISEVLEGDEVLTHRGRWRRVTATMRRRHSGELVKIRPVGGLALEATPEHPVYTTKMQMVGSRSRRHPDPVRVAPSRAWTWTPAADLETGRRLDGDALLVPSVEAGPGATLDMAAVLRARTLKWGARWAVEDGKCYYGGREKFSSRIPITTDVARLLGLYLAEGAVSGARDNQHVVVFAFHKRERHLHEFVADQARRVFGAAARKVPHRMTKGLRVAIGSAPLARLLRSFGKSHTKAVPWELWRSMDAIQRAHVACGWMMGDGSRRGCGVSAMSVSPNLIEQMRQALIGVGLSPSVHKFMKAGTRIWNGKISRNRDSWSVSLANSDTEKLAAICPEFGTHFANRFGVKGTRKRDNTPRWSVPEGVAAKLAEVSRREFDGWVYNLHVDSDESYCVEGVAVHNCWIARELARSASGGGGPPMRHRTKLEMAQAAGGY